MKKTVEFRKRFLESRDDSGRFLVTSYRTGKTYFVEPIGPDRAADWGDVNPVTKKQEGSYGQKYRGSINESESLLTKENGFDKVYYTGIGGSPFSVIDEMDAKHPSIN